jgi:branched-chain amino acid aminotransferase
MSLVPFDDRDGVIWFDGKLIPWRDAKLHVLTHAMHYAAAAFEGERAYDGRVFKSRPHSERLHRSAELLEKGIRLKWAKYRRPSPETAPTASKASGLYMICTISKHDAEKDGYQDAMMLDYRGQLAEATGANVFLVQNGELHTPKPDCFLNGITRQTVIELARRRQIKVVERAILPEELSKTQEVFLVGTAAEVTPVGQVGDYKFTVGPITKQLREDYLKEVRAPATSAAAE